MVKACVVMPPQQVGHDTGIACVLNKFILLKIGRLDKILWFENELMNLGLYILFDISCFEF